MVSRCELFYCVIALTDRQAQVLLEALHAYLPPKDKADILTNTHTEVVKAFCHPVDLPIRAAILTNRLSAKDKDALLALIRR